MKTFEGFVEQIKVQFLANIPNGRERDNTFWRSHSSAAVWARGFSDKVSLILSLRSFAIIFGLLNHLCAYIKTYCFGVSRCSNDHAPERLRLKVLNLKNKSITLFFLPTNCTLLQGIMILTLLSLSGKLRDVICFQQEFIFYHNTNCVSVFKHT